MARAHVVPITTDHINEAVAYLTPSADYARSKEQWERVLRWAAARHPDNLGFQLRSDDRIVGIFVATFGETAAGRRVCHLGTWEVKSDYRLYSLQLFRAFFDLPVDVFTDYKPVPHVRPINRRFGFRDMDSRTVAIWNLRWPSLRRGVSLISDPERIDGLLDGRDLQVFRDHRQVPGVGQVVLRSGDRNCLVVFRESAGRVSKARLLFISDRTLFRANPARVLWHILRRYRSPFTVAELRTLGGPMPLTRAAPAVARQYRSAAVPESELDELYSPLVWAT